MRASLDHMYNQLRVKLRAIDRHLEAAQGADQNTSEQSHRRLESLLDSIDQRISDNRQIVSTATTLVTAWSDLPKPGCVAFGPPEGQRLSREYADRAEAYASAVFDLAGAAADRAAKAGLGALLARAACNRAGAPSV